MITKSFRESLEKVYGLHEEKCDCDCGKSPCEKCGKDHHEMKEALDPVDKSELKGKHKDRKDKDIDNDGDVDKSDQYLHRRRKAVSKAMDEPEMNQEETELDEAIKLGSKVKMHGPGKDYHDQVGHVGEIRHGAFKGADKTYTVDYGNRKSVQLQKNQIKLHKEEIELDEGVHRISVTVSEPDHPAVSKRKETQQKFVRVTHHDKSEAQKKGEQHFKKKGYKVHSSEHVGMVESTDAYGKKEGARRNTNEDLKEAGNPTGVKIYHKDRSGKESHTIHFTARSASEHEKEMKKMGHKITGRSLMYGKKEGARRNTNEDIERSTDVKRVKRKNPSTGNVEWMNVRKPIEIGKGKMESKMTTSDLIETAANRAQDKTAGEKNVIPQGSSNIHNCAKKVMHETWGKGDCIPMMHAEPDANGHVAWYDVMFEHGLERNVSVEDLDILLSSMHGHKKK